MIFFYFGVDFHWRPRQKNRLAFNTSLFTRIYAMKSAVANFYVSVGAALLDNNYEKNQNVLYSTNANKWCKIMELVVARFLHNVAMKFFQS